MDPIIGGLLAGGGSLLSGLFQSQTSAQNAQLQFAQSQLGLKESEDYNTAMSNTAYRRASADMQAAGLNPAMMFGSGAAASTPQVGAPPLPTAQKQSAWSNLGDVLPKVISTASAVKGLDKLEAETEKAKQDAVTAGNTASATGLALPEARRKAAEEEAKLADMEGVKRKAETEQQYGPWAAPFVQPYQSVVSGLNRLVDKTIESVTGPSGKALWDKARGSWPSFSNPNVRGTTLNNDFGTPYNTP